MKRTLAPLALACLLAACTGLPDRGGPRQDRLVLAAWNVEHLAERNDSGCRPRTDADYVALRQHVQRLGADVIAFQEVESRAAAERIFDPALYEVVIEERAGSGTRGACRGEAGLTINPQKVGFAVRRGLAFDRAPDFTVLQLGDADLRSGVDITLRPRGAPPLRLLSVHLKSGCAAGASSNACPTLFQQVPVLERWIDARASEGMRFAVLGDFNRRLAMAGDTVWADWDDAQPANADLTLAAGTRGAQCNPRYRDFIDHIVLDAQASRGLREFRELTYPAEALSDHCAIAATVELR